MTDFILALGKINLSMSVAIVAVYLLRRPVRKLFQAQVSYLLWVLIPIAGVGSLLPPRVTPAVSFVPVQMTPRFLSTGTHVTAQLPMIPSVEHLGAHLAQPVVALQTTMTASQMAFDLPMFLFYVWVLGLMLTVAYFTRQQARFHAAARRGEAGPAIVGFWRPRLVIPLDFSLQYTAREQAAILAHEHAHLERQDFRISGLVALMRCICWFNPLVHLGAKWLQIDQELACDAAALSREISPMDYARALMKTQLATTLLPLGCAWPSSGHPLTERIALLTRKRPSAGRRASGMALVIFAALFMGIGAWAAEPPVPGEPLLQSQSPDSGTVAAIQHEIDKLENGRSAYSNYFKQEEIRKLGALRSVTFYGLDTLGDDEHTTLPSTATYLAKFDNGIIPISVASDGTIIVFKSRPISDHYMYPPYPTLVLRSPPAFQRGGYGPSPGLVAALRFNIDALEKGKPYSGFALATSQQFGYLLQTAKPLGAVQSLTFQEIDPRGMDVYKAVYAHGSATWSASPLEKGKLNIVLASNMKIVGKPLYPSTEEAMRRFIQSLEQGRPNYDGMTPAMADLVHQQLPNILAHLKQWGAPKSITYEGANAFGLMYTFVETFEHGRLDWVIEPSSADDRVEKFLFLVPDQAA